MIGLEDHLAVRYGCRHLATPGTLGASTTCAARKRCSLYLSRRLVATGMRCCGERSGDGQDIELT